MAAAASAAAPLEQQEKSQAQQQPAMLPRVAYSRGSLHSHQIGTVDSAQSEDSDAFEAGAVLAAPDAEGTFSGNIGGRVFAGGAVAVAVAAAAQQAQLAGAFGTFRISEGNGLSDELPENAGSSFSSAGGGSVIFDGGGAGISGSAVIGSAGSGSIVGSFAGGQAAGSGWLRSQTPAHSRTPSRAASGGSQSFAAADGPSPLPPRPPPAQPSGRSGRTNPAPYSPLSPASVTSPETEAAPETPELAASSAASPAASSAAAAPPQPRQQMLARGRYGANGVAPTTPDPRTASPQPANDAAAAAAAQPSLQQQRHQAMQQSVAQMLALLGRSADPAVAPFAAAAQELFRPQSGPQGSEPPPQPDLGLLGNALMSQWRAAATGSAAAGKV